MVAAHRMAVVAGIAAGRVATTAELSAAAARFPLHRPIFTPGGRKPCAKLWLRQFGA